MHLQANAFELEGDLSGFTGYQRGGIVTQHKAPKQLSFKPLQAALQDPGELMLTDFSKIERPGLLHLGFQALDAFQVCMSAWWQPQVSAVPGRPGAYVPAV